MRYDRDLVMSSSSSTRLVLLGRDSLTETWLVDGDDCSAQSTWAAVRLVRQACNSPGGDASALRRVAARVVLGRDPRPRGAEETWAVLEAALLRRRLTVQVVSKPAPRTDPARRDLPIEPPTPDPPAPIVDEDRSLFIVRCEPELLDDAPLRFDYMIRGLAGQPVTLRILSETFVGKVVHERSLSAAQTEDQVHAATWDGIVTVGDQYRGKRLPPEYGPCTLEIVHDETFRDEAEFTLSRVVLTITLDGFFHTGSAMFLPTRRAQGGVVAPRPFDNQDELHDWIATEPQLVGPEFDVPFQPPSWYELRETVGLSMLAHILAECGSSNTTRRLILAGHTSAAGSDAFNDSLADARARCVHSLLLADADGFESALEDFWVIEDAYVILRYCGRMRGWACDPGEPSSPATAAYYEAVRNFQLSYNEAFERNIDVDGDVGPQTRGAFFEIYQSVLAGAFGSLANLDKCRAGLRVHGPNPTLACGERYGAAARRPGEDIDDRRVEALLFLPNEPVPKDAAAIYDHDTFHFVEWSLPVETDCAQGPICEELVHVEPAPEPSDGDELEVYQPGDLDNPWDFLNAFRGVTNRAGVYRG